MLKRPQEPSAEGKADCGGIHQSSAMDPPALTGSVRLLGGKVPPYPTAPFCHEPTAPAMCKGALWEASTQHFFATWGYNIPSIYFRSHIPVSHPDFRL